MKHLTKQRCCNHGQREAAAQCPECKRFFCRECVTEHESRVICSICLKKPEKPPFRKRFHFLLPVRAFQWLTGLFFTWLFFYYLGQALLHIPTSFHEGKIWESGWSCEKKQSE